jgi:membrane associated rhomboid family serine protease
MEDPLNIKEIPVSVFLAVTIIIIFSLYFTNLLKSVPCQKNLGTIFINNFIHIDIYHLVGNILGLYSISRIERTLGTKKFIILITCLLVIASMLEIAIFRIVPSIPCGIGISGLLFGLITWELIMIQKLDFTLVLSIIFTVVLPSLKGKNVSIFGHLSGIIAGIVVGFSWKKIYK